LNEDKRQKENAEREEKMIEQALGKKKDPNLCFTPGQNGLVNKILKNVWILIQINDQ
jgi:hypothetical protein